MLSARGFNWNCNFKGQNQIVLVCSVCLVFSSFNIYLLTYLIFIVCNMLSKSLIREEKHLAIECHWSYEMTNSKFHRNRVEYSKRVVCNAVYLVADRCGMPPLNRLIACSLATSFNWHHRLLQFCIVYVFHPLSCLTMFAILAIFFNFLIRYDNNLLKNIVKLTNRF